MKEKGKSTHKEGDKHESSITDLPSPIIFDILLKLPVKGILVCKCVCKNWFTIVSDPQFAKQQFAQAEPCALLRTLDSTHVPDSRILYLVEPKDCHNFDLGYCICEDEADFRCDRHMELDNKLKIPLRNAEMVLSSEGGDAQMGCRPNGPNFKIVNSCHGMLCLSEPESNEPVAVCNPVTGEYISLPMTKRAEEKTQYFVECGFGFSPQTDQYKVVRMFERWSGDPVMGMAYLNTAASGPINYSNGIEIYTLGTAGSWKSIGDAPFLYSSLAFSTYLKGCIHWLISLEFSSTDYMFSFGKSSSTDYIVSFNFDTEQLQLFPSPPHEYDNSDEDDDIGMVGLSTKHNVSMGVLEDCLCICDANYDPIYIWVMKEYGVRESWTTLFSIDNQLDQGWPYGLYQPINYLKNGAVLMFHYLKCAVVCYDPERPTLKYLTIHGAESNFEAIVYVPSLISLKDAIIGDNVVVLNVSSRYAGIEVQGETKALSLAEVREPELDSD
ncbi:F-box protein At3g07870-like [Cornus florida]|uniref:F-box protein At3g07870-like n=1 Tax=Cornus florida TaxID=4283 RepID=UPI00289B30EF|nr:F-box protein At3g07870-like [Cornus florida]